MTTIIVEDGSYTQTSGNGTKGVPGANSYITEAGLVTYAAARGYTFVTSTNIMILQAMDYLESLAFVGTKFSFTQNLQWPRTNVIIDNWWQPPATIPQLLIDAQCEIAMAIDNGESPVQTIQPKKTRIKAGSVEVDYAVGSSSTPLNRKIMTKLRKLVINGSGFAVVKA